MVRVRVLRVVHVYALLCATSRKLRRDSIRERIRSGRLVKTARLAICTVRVGVGRIGFWVVYMRNMGENFLEG